MAVKYIYSNQVANKLPGSNKNYYFRTVTEYVVDSNGKPTGEARTMLFYAPRAGARGPGGSTWTNGTADSLSNFDKAGWVAAAATDNGGKSFQFLRYTQRDVDNGIISADKLGTPVLGATARQSLTTPGGIFYETIQNTLINTAVKTQPGLAQVVSAKQQNAVSGGGGGAGGGGGSGGGAPTPPDLPPPPTQDEIDDVAVNDAVNNRQDIDLRNIAFGEKNRSNYGNYYYPLDLQSNKQDRIIFTMKSIAGSKISAKFNNNQPIIQRTFKTNDEGKSTISGSVTLPIQPSITDSSSVDWSGGTLNPIQAFGAASALQLIQSSNVTDLGSNVGEILGKIMQELKGGDQYSEALKLWFAQEAVGAQGLLSRATGAVLNPNLELLFNGPSLRPFNFTFRLSPRDKSEAEQVRKIIRFFKQGMSVKQTNSQVFLKAPNVFDIRYQSYDNNGNIIADHPSLNRIKTCALLSCDVDYTPDGTYMTYNDEKRSMTSYQLSLRFSELDPIYDSDYTELDGDDETKANYQIGY